MPTAREIAAARERREWIDAENRRIHEEEDKAQYAIYVQQMNAERLTPVPYEEWRKLLPADDNPAVRGCIATDRVTRKELLTVAKDLIAKRPLSDDELSEFGFDIRYRPNYEMEQFSPSIIGEVFRRFREQEPRFDVDLHLEPVLDLLQRNRLTLVGPHLEIAFNLFLGLGLIEPKAVAELAPPRPEGINAYGVNLQVDPDPAIEARKRRERYESELVVTDPETGKRWTQFQLDNLADSETFRRLMRIPRITKNPAREPKH